MANSPAGTPKNTGIRSYLKEWGMLFLVVFLVRTFVFGLYQVPTGSMETTMLVGERFFADKVSYLFRKPERGEIIALNQPDFPYHANPVIRLYQEYIGWPIWPWGPVNFTKRVIGIPGDHVKGVIENGRPVVYLNGKKLDEPYLNKYPLLALWSSSNRYQADLELRSYDPAKPFNEQPYYRINPDRIIYQSHIKPEYFDLMRPNLTITSAGLLLYEPYRPIMDGGVPVAWSTPGAISGDEYEVTLGKDEYWLMGDNRRGSKDSRFFGPVAGRLIHGRILYRIWSSDSDEQWWIIDLIKHPVDFWQRMRWSRFFQRVC